MFPHLNTEHCGITAVEGHTIEYRQALDKDVAQIQNLLACYTLPKEGCRQHLQNFFVAEENNIVVGVGGYEVCGGYALLRSFAVKSTHQGLGVAEKIFDLLKGRAEASEIGAFYLLTTTAPDYFQRLGFSRMQRSDAPAQIMKSEQFLGLCPDSAVMMSFDLQ